MGVKIHDQFAFYDLACFIPDRLPSFAEILGIPPKGTLQGAMKERMSIFGCMHIINLVCAIVLD